MPASIEARRALRGWVASGRLPRPANASEATSLVAAAVEQGLAGLLQAAVMADAAGWPDAERAALRASHRGAFARGVRQLDLAARALGLLEARGLPALPLKGAAVAETLYHSVADRPMGDVDLLALGDYPAARELLIAAGFRPLAEADHACALVDPVSGGVLELHHAVTSCPGLFPLDPTGLWARRREGPGQVPRRPSAEDLLVQLALHATFQHGLVLSLVQHLDLRRLLERTPPDPTRALAIADAAGAAPAVAVALELAAATVAAPVPEALRAAFAPQAPSRLLARLRGCDPLEFVLSARPQVARVRWELAAGRRLALLRLTLAPDGDGPRRAWPRRLLAGAGRAVGLVWRFGVTARMSAGKARRAVAR